MPVRIPAVGCGEYSGATSQERDRGIALAPGMGFSLRCAGVPPEHP